MKNLILFSTLLALGLNYGCSKSDELADNVIGVDQTSPHSPNPSVGAANTSSPEYQDDTVTTSAAAPAVAVPAAVVVVTESTTKTPAAEEKTEEKKVSQSDSGEAKEAKSQDSNATAAATGAAAGAATGAAVSNKGSSASVKDKPAKEVTEAKSASSDMNTEKPSKQVAANNKKSKETIEATKEPEPVQMEEAVVIIATPVPVTAVVPVAAPIRRKAVESEYEAYNYKPSNNEYDAYNK